MTNTPSLPTLLSSLTGSLTSSLSSLPSPSAIQPPPSSFSLLSTKNELFLSYLQNLTFLIILTLRGPSGGTELPKSSSSHSESKAATEGKNNENSAAHLRDAVVEKLIELRVYLEKGVRPLEGRLKYQLDKLLLAAADHARETANHQLKPSAKIKDRRADDSKESPNASDAPSSGDDDGDGPTLSASSINPLVHRPNPSAMIRPPSTNHGPPTSATSMATGAPYRPPRMNPTAPPTDSASKRGPRRSRAMDAFIREEMGDAPVAEMSIGAGRGAAGEGGRQAERERERKEWEETKLARLPGEKKRRRGAGDEFLAGMDWGLDDEERGGGEERERKRKKKGKLKNGGGGGKRRGRK